MWLNQECLLQLSINCAVLGMLMAAYCLDLCVCVCVVEVRGHHCYIVFVSRRVEGDDKCINQ